MMVDDGDGVLSRGLVRVTGYYYGLPILSCVRQVAACFPAKSSHR